MDTIFAISSGRPPAAIAVVRISGPGAFVVGAALAGSLPPLREAQVRTLRDADGTVLDKALVLAFRGPRSATGEDVVELHCHGGRAVVAAVERGLRKHPGVRAATPGEFTRQALTNGRIDLVEAEGLADLLAAETERQRRAAMTATEGQVSRAVAGWLERIMVLAAGIEAMLDFADEEDVAATNHGIASIIHDALALGDEIMAAVESPAVDRLRDGIRVVLAGPPNAGKSTLLNLLADRDVSIVTPIAGTTRDRIEASVAREGIPYVLSDTAGLTDSVDPVERIGVERARDAMMTADIVVWLGDDPPPVPAIWLHSRADDPHRHHVPAEVDLAVAQSDIRSIVALWERIGVAASRLLPEIDAVAFTGKQVAAAGDAAVALHTMPSDDPLIVAEHLRRASLCLGSILGIGVTEAMLDALFARFCIGK